MTTNSKSGSFNAGKKAAMRGRPPTPEGQYDQAKYMHAYGIWSERMEKKAAAENRKTRKINPIAHCGYAQCKTARREKAFKVYDVASDRLFCDEPCHDSWRAL